MEIKKRELAKRLKCSLSTLNVYLDRGDFCKIENERGKLKNIFPSDIELLRTFIHTRGGKYKGVRYDN